MHTKSRSHPGALQCRHGYSAVESMHYHRTSHPNPSKRGMTVFLGGLRRLSNPNDLGTMRLGGRWKVKPTHEMLPASKTLVLLPVILVPGDAIQQLLWGQQGIREVAFCSSANSSFASFAPQGPSKLLESVGCQHHLHHHGRIHALPE